MDRHEEAKILQQSPILSDALAAIKQASIEVWANAESLEERERQHVRYQLVDSLEVELYGRINEHIRK